MGNYYYSSSNNGFFNDDIHTNLPKDSVYVREEYYNKIFNDLSTGLILSSDKEGYPITVPYNLTSAASKKAERVWRNSELQRSDIEILKLQDSIKNNNLLKAWREYRNLLRDWPKSEKFPLSDFRPNAPDKKDNICHS